MVEELDAYLEDFEIGTTHVCDCDCASFLGEFLDKAAVADSAVMFDPVRSDQ